MVKHYSVYVCWECLWMRLTSECRWDSSNPLKPCRHAQLSLFVTLWTVAHQAPLSMGFSKQEYWSGLPCPPPGDLPNPGIEYRSPTLWADSLLSELPAITINTCNKTGQQYPLEKGKAGYPLQYSCLENPMDKGAWWATVHGVAKSQT